MDESWGVLVIDRNDTVTLHYSPCGHLEAVRLTGGQDRYAGTECAEAREVPDC